MVRVTGLAHAGLQAKSLRVQAEFYNDRWGLEPVDEFRSDLPLADIDQIMHRSAAALFGSLVSA